MRSWAGAGAVAVLLYASLRLLLASLYAMDDTPEGVTKALAWTPGDALLHQRYASLWRTTERRDMVRKHLEASVRLNPRLTASRLALAGQFENAGEAAGAEALLLETARLDRQFDPRWALANFYFRRGERGQFESWLESASGIAYDGGRPLFALAWRAGLTPQFVQSRIVRGRAPLARSMLAYAVEAKDVHWTVEAARAVADPDLLLQAVEMLLYAGRIDEAAAIWNCIPGRPAATGQGFDWRILPAPGVRVSTHDGLLIDFSAADARAYDLASRIFPVWPDSSVSLATVSVADSDSGGFRWTVSSWPGLQVLAERALPDASSFAVPAGVRAVRLLLSYERPAGKIRFNGVMRVTTVRVETKNRRRAPEKELAGEIRGSYPGGQAGQGRSNCEVRTEFVRDAE